MTEQHKQTLKEDLIIRGIKLLDIGYITTIYVLGGVYVASFLDNYVYPHINFNKNIPDEKKKTEQILIELIICLIIMAISSYILRNILQKIPFPLDKKFGFEHMKVKEVQTGNILFIVLLLFSKSIKTKIYLLQSRIEKK